MLLLITESKEEIDYGNDNDTENFGCPRWT